ncbi:uncharacterized protein LOC126686180 isoform X1 [Mercurialis annua]|uniref:uncharacterized protein LOC126686180 isoform X1 n=1 Tax=Mercurialis annua TaxID=3986 RepID=UPI002160BEFD|nr:uncharacterized protein LOC126686180 isoform X1 [Mercurialis annua]
MGKREHDFCPFLFPSAAYGSPSSLSSSTSSPPSSPPEPSYSDTQSSSDHYYCSSPSITSPFVHLSTTPPLSPAPATRSPAEKIGNLNQQHAEQCSSSSSNDSLSEDIIVDQFLQGKWIQDDHETLTETGIAHDYQLDSLAFSLEPIPFQTLPLFSPQDSSLDAQLELLKSLQMQEARILQIQKVRLLQLEANRRLHEQPEVEMDLETSFRKESAFKNSRAALFDDLCAPNNVKQNVLSSNDFRVDELLDFSNEEDEGDLVLQGLISDFGDFGGKDDFESISGSELCIPLDDLASLEWLSHFVEDSNLGYSAPFPAGAFHGGSELLTENCYKTSFPVKARSKRTRKRIDLFKLSLTNIYKNGA